MKTNVVMVRKMGEYVINQRTSDGMFNASELLNQWQMSNNERKDIDSFFKIDKTKEFIEVLENDIKSNTENNRNSNKSISYIILKGNKSKGIKNQIWMHPFLFIDFAMWINPKFKLEVIRFVYDQLIKQRHLAGDNYKGLTNSLTMFSNVNYSQIAKALNYIVFGEHKDGLRQNANENQLKELTDIQQKLSFAVDMGYIRSFDELMNEMRKMWHKKHD